MNFLGIFKASSFAFSIFYLPVFLGIGITSTPGILFAQDIFSYTKNKWQQTEGNLHLKKMGVYSDFENVFFLKRAGKKPSKSETWAIFGGEGGTISLQRNDSFAYEKGKLNYAQDELSLTPLSDEPVRWQLNSQSDTLFFQYEASSQTCRLYRTIKISESPLFAQPFKEVGMLRFSVENEELKRIKIEEQGPFNQRWTSFRIFACFLSAYAFSQNLN